MKLRSILRRTVSAYDSKAASGSETACTMSEPAPIVLRGGSSYAATRSSDPPDRDPDPAPPPFVNDTKRDARMSNRNDPFSRRGCTRIVAGPCCGSINPMSRPSRTCGFHSTVTILLTCAASRAPCVIPYGQRRHQGLPLPIESTVLRRFKARCPQGLPRPQRIEPDHPLRQRL